MYFNSFEYALFLALIATACWLLHQTRRQNILLLIASYIFYARWDWRFLPLLLLMTIMNYWLGHAIENAPPNRARSLLVASLLVNLGILGFFKYFDFFIGSAEKLLITLGVQVNRSSLAIILPIGLSYYTFELISYAVDIYQKQFKPERSFWDFALYVSFFPKLLAGPIERVNTLLPQIKERRPPGPEQIESGLLLILLGLFKKIVIADVAATLTNSAAFTTPNDVSPGVVLQALYLFALQIYGDFSGYSDIARGSARLLGFELIVNFNHPYFSANITDFWARWHISLSTWLRDYIFYPFSRSMLRRNRGRHALRIQIGAYMLTMFASGVWHGANLTFILWGLLHGVYLSGHRLLVNRKLLPVKTTSIWGKRLVHIASILVTFHLVLIAWVLFHTPSIRYVPAVYLRLSQTLFVGLGSDALDLFLPVIVLYLVMFAIDAGQSVTSDDTFFRLLPAPVRSLTYVAAISLMIFFAVKPYVPFIYFRF